MKVQRAYSWLLALLIPAFAVQIALANPIEEHAYDAAAFHIYRGVVFSDARADGVLYPRWVSEINAGLGGPLFSFYSPLVYFGMDALHWLGLSHPVAWRVLVAASLILASLGMFLLGLSLFKRADLALVAAACFTYAPYLLRDFFQRGAPQGMAIALYPWLLWSLLQLVERPSGWRFAFTAICWAAIALLHNLSAALILPIVGLFCIFLAIKSRRENRIRALWLPIAALIAGLLLAAFHVLPFALESKYVQLAGASGDVSMQPATNSVAANDLLGLPTIFDTGLDNNATGEDVGILHVLVMLAGTVVAILLWWRKRIAEAILVGGICLWGLFSLWMQLDIASPLWRALPQLDILQFRTRLLNIIAIIAAIAGGYVLEFALEQVRSVRFRSAILILFGGIFIAMQLPWLYPQLLHNYVSFSPNPTAAEAQAWAIKNHIPGLTLTATSELLPRWRRTIFTDDEVAKIARSPVDNLPDGAHILDYTHRTGELHIKLETPSAFNAALHMLYFPGWAGYLNGTAQPLAPMDVSGYTLLNIPEGTNTIDLRYEGTSVQHAADLISVISALLLLILAIIWRRPLKTMPPDSPSPSSVHSPAPLTFERKSWIGSPLFLRLLPRTRGREKASGDRGVGDKVNQAALIHPIYPSPHWWLPIGLIALIILKGVWLDPKTTLLRHASTCDAIWGASAQANATFAGNIRLCGYTISGTSLHPGDTLHITLYWEIAQPENDGPGTFVHLLGTAFNPATNNPLWGQQDKQTPGWLPLPNWVTGKLYQDVYDFSIVPNTPPGPYQLEIGWTGLDGKRLKPLAQLVSPSLSVSNLDSLLVSGLEVK